MKLAPSKAFWIGIATVVVLLGIPTALALKQRSDMAAVQKYVERIQPRLSADSRFNGVRLLGYSCSTIMHPYIPMSGTVPTQQDWDDLKKLIQNSEPPVFISINGVTIGPNQAPQIK
jgi:hypothetical protein